VIASSTTYYPFGLPISTRTGDPQTYRFGFQGQEKDPEWTAQQGSHLAFKYRIHDARIGRFLSVDPLTAKFPMLTPYQFASNTPIWAIELEGLEGIAGPSFASSYMQVRAACDLQTTNDIFNAQYKASAIGLSLFAGAQAAVGFLAASETTQCVLTGKFIMGSLYKGFVSLEHAMGRREELTGSFGKDFLKSVGLEQVDLAFEIGFALKDLDVTKLPELAMETIEALEKEGFDIKNDELFNEIPEDAENIEVNYSVNSVLDEETETETTNVKIEYSYTTDDEDVKKTQNKTFSKVEENNGED
jgi:RHS repeat-associated protein